MSRVGCMQVLTTAPCPPSGDQRDWRSYKAELKDYIYDFDGNLAYRSQKLKVGSLRQHECFVGAIDASYEVLSGAQLEALLDGRGPLLRSYEPPLAQPLIWLSLIMPSDVATARARPSAAAAPPLSHVSAATVLDAAELDASERDWLVRVAGSQARAQPPSYVADPSLVPPVAELSPSVDLRGGALRTAAQLLALFGVGTDGDAASVRAAAGRPAPPRERPLRWPYRSDPARMGMLVADERHVASAVAAGRVSADVHGRQFGRGSLRLSVRSLADEHLQLHIPAGSLCIPDSTSEQTLIASKDTQLELAPGQVVDLGLDAFCGISSNACPRGPMELSRYVVPREVVTSQRSVWHWSSPHEPSSDAGARSWFFWDDDRPTPARQEFDIIEREFPDEAEELRDEFGGDERSDTAGGVDTVSASASADASDDAQPMQDTAPTSTDGWSFSSGTSSTPSSPSSSSNYDGWFSDSSGGDSG